MILNIREFSQNYIWRLIQVLSKQGVPLVLFFISATLLSVDGLGIYSYLLSIVFFFVIFSDFGISAATSKYIAQYSQVNENKSRLILKSAFSLSFILIIFSIALLFVFWYFYLKIDLNLILSIIPILVFAPITSVFDGAYRGLQNFKKLSIITTAVSIPVPIVAYLMIDHFGIIGALMIQSFYYVFLAFTLALNYKDLDFKFCFDYKTIKELASYSIFFGLSVLSFYFLSKIDVFILGHFGHFDLVAVYEVINKLLLIFFTVFVIFSDIIAPKVTKDFSLEKHKHILRFFIKYFSINTVIVMLSATVFYYLISPFIFFLSPNYTYELISVFLLPSIFIFIVAAISVPLKQGIIAPCGFVKAMGIINILSIPINIILSTIFYSHYGAVGVVYGTACATLIASLILHFFIVKKIYNNAKTSLI